MRRLSFFALIPLTGLILASGGFATTESAQNKKFACNDFGRKPRVQVTPTRKANEVKVHYAIEKAPADAFYVLRVWLEGRHNKNRWDKDIEIGQLSEGESVSKDVMWTIDADNDTTFRADFDFDIWKDGADYRSHRQGATMGQCDPGLRDVVVKVPPPPTPPKPGETECVCHVDGAKRKIVKICAQSAALAAHKSHTGDRPVDAGKVCSF